MTVKGELKGGVYGKIQREKRGERKEVTIL